MSNGLLKKISILMLWVSIIMFLFGLAILSFFNHACADDYIALTWNHQYGFIGYQKQVYLHWGGRYVSNLLASAFSYHNFLISHYYFHTLLLLSLTFVSVFYLIKVANRYLLSNSSNFGQRLTISAIVCVNMYVVYPELATGLFWFSSAITYQTSIVLLVLLLGVCISLFECSPKMRPFFFVFLLLLIILINGTNELAVLLSGVMLLWFAFINKDRLKQWWLFVAVIALFYLSSFAFMSMAPGNKERLALFGNTGYHIPYAVATTLFRIFLVYWNIFQSPLFWVSILAIFIYGYHIQLKGTDRNRHLVNSKRIWALVFGWTVVFFAFLLPILVISNGSIPDRALNLLGFASMLVFFIISLYWGMGNGYHSQLTFLSNPKVLPILLLALSCTIFANRGSKEMASSLISARNYALIMTKREQALSVANQKGIESVSLPLIDSAMNRAVEMSAQKATIKEWMKHKPSLLYFEDDMADSGSRAVLQNFYNIKVIAVEK